MLRTNEDSHELISNCYKVNEVAVSINLELNGTFTVFQCTKTGEYVIELDTHWFSLIDADNQVVGEFSADLGEYELLLLTEACLTKLDQNTRTSARLQLNALKGA